MNNATPRSTPVLNESLESRVLVVAPTRKDAAVTKGLLGQAGIFCEICESMDGLVGQVNEGAGAILITEEGLISPGMFLLATVLKNQPSWSDLPVVVLLKGSSDSEAVLPALRLLPNVTVVERPAPLRSVLSAVEAALRARSRQYEIRDQVQEIARAAEQFKVMANAIPQLAWMAEADGSIFWYNRRWYEYTGTTFEQMAGWGWKTVHDPEVLPTVIENWEAALEKGKPFEMEYPIKGADGSFKLFLTQAEPIRDEAGTVIRWFGTNTDIEEHRKLREAREQMLESERSARMEAERAARVKDEFLATLSHELRTPLSAILGWAYIMKLKPDDAKAIHDGVQVIERSGEALKYLVEDLLDISRIASGKLHLNLSDVSLPTIIESSIESVEPAAQSKGVEIKRDLAIISQKVKGDASRLQQVLWNLLSNAIKFTPKGGVVTVALKENNDSAMISVTDTGEGIPEEFLPFLFDRFRQSDSTAARKHGGMGIGLSLVKQFTELHGGSVSAVSEGQGKGSTVTICLPLRQQLLDEDSPEEARPSIQNVSVLVVDDEPGIRDFLRRVLEDNGAHVHVAESAPEALSMLAEDPPDLLVCDIGLPNQDGYELLGLARRQGFESPAIALTAFARDQDRSRALAAGFQKHLAKPVDTERLISAIADLASVG